MVQYFLIAAAILLFLAVWGLLIQRSDLRLELKWATDESKRWKEEAVRRGWKGPFEECVDALNDCAGKARQACQALEKAAAGQNEVNAKLKRLAEASRQAAGRYARGAEALAGSSAANDDRTKTASAGPSPDEVRARLLRETVRKAEADAAAGRRVTDRLKLN